MKAIKFNFHDIIFDQVREDCLAYKPRTGEWYVHSTMTEAREEAASAVVSGNMYVMGGLVGGKISNSSEVLEIEDNDGTTWKEGPKLPESRSRFCAVAIDATTLAILVQKRYLKPILL